MKLDDFLNSKKVRCLSNNYAFNKQGKAYKLHGLRVLITDETGCAAFFPIEDFEPVLDSAENPLQDMELTPETEASEPKFEVGNKVYKYGETDVKTVLEVFENGYMRISNYPYRVNRETLCHATQENCERLQATFPDIEFEHPPTQEDIDNEAVDKLAQAMKNKLAKKREQGYKGWETCKHGDLVQLLINHVDKGDPIDVANFCAFLFARGEQLTQGGTR